MKSKLRFFTVIFILLLFTLIRYLYPAVAKIGYKNWELPIVYLIILGITLLLFTSKRMNREGKTKRQTVLILTGIYLIVFLLIGLIIDFERNIYWGKWTAMIQFLFNSLPVIIIQEITRVKLIEGMPKKRVWIYFSLIVLAFFALEFNFVRFEENFKDFSSITAFIFDSCLLGLVKQGILTYIAYKCGLGAVLINRILIIAVMTITPILPNLSDRFFIGMYDFIFYVIFWFVIGYEAITLDRDVRKEVIRRSNPFVYLILLSILLLFVSFQIGFFTYYPTAIISNSMKPLFIRGDAVVVKKLKKEGIHELVVGDIIEYRLGNRNVVHRIIEIDKSNTEEWLFTTKGDYNNSADADKVTEDQIKGIMKFTIPWIGYPSVYFTEYFNDQTPAPVETGGD